MRTSIRVVESAIVSALREKELVKCLFDAAKNVAVLAFVATVFVRLFLLKPVSWINFVVIVALLLVISVLLLILCTAYWQFAKYHVYVPLVRCVLVKLHPEFGDDIPTDWRDPRLQGQPSIVQPVGTDFKVPETQSEIVLGRLALAVVVPMTIGFPIAATMFLLYASGAIKF